MPTVEQIIEQRKKMLESGGAISPTPAAKVRTIEDVLRDRGYRTPESIQNVADAQEHSITPIVNQAPQPKIINSDLQAVDKRVPAASSIPVITPQINAVPQMSYPEFKRQEYNIPDIVAGRPIATPLVTPVISRNQNTIVNDRANPTPAKAGKVEYENQPSWGKTVGSSILGGIAQTQTGMFNLPRKAIEGVSIGLDALLPKFIYSKEMQESDPIKRALDNAVKSNEERAMQYQKDLEGAKGIKGFVAAGLPALPQIVMAAFGGAAAGGSSALSGLSTAAKQLIPFGALAAGGYAREAENDGASYGQQVAYGLLGGTAEAATEVIPLGNALNLMKKFGAGEIAEKGAKTLIGKYGKTAMQIIGTKLSEGLQEAIMSPIGRGAKKLAYDHGMELTGKDGVWDWGDIKQSAYGGIAMAVILGGLGLPASYASHKLAAAKIESGEPITPEFIQNELMPTLQQDTTAIENESNQTAKIQQAPAEFNWALNQVLKGKNIPPALEKKYPILVDIRNNLQAKQPEDTTETLQEPTSEVQNAATETIEPQIEDSLKVPVVNDAPDNLTYEEYQKLIDAEEDKLIAKYGEGRYINNATGTTKDIPENELTYVNKLYDKRNEVGEQDDKNARDNITNNLDDVDTNEWVAEKSSVDKALKNIQTEVNFENIEGENKTKTIEDIRRKLYNELIQSTRAPQELWGEYDNAKRLVENEANSPFGKSLKPLFKQIDDIINVTVNGKQKPTAKTPQAPTKEEKPTVEETIKEGGKQAQNGNETVRTLKDYGLEVKKTKTNKGNDVWQVPSNDNTKEYVSTFHKLKARWYKPHPKAKGVWSFNYDPTEDLLKELTGAENVTDSQRQKTEEKPSKPTTTTDIQQTETQIKPEDGKQGYINSGNNDTLKVKDTADKKESSIPIQKVADYVIDKLTKGEKFTNADLIKAADEAYGGTQAQATYSRKDATDAMELGVNQYLIKQKDIDFTIRNIDEVIENIAKLRELLELIPTQTNRTDEQVAFQQFSTPPTIAYLASWLANISNKDVVLEPSAGIGGLALFGKVAGAKVYVNELSERRAEVLKQMGFDGLFMEDGEQLNNILPDYVEPTVVIMNPPFSSAGHRTGNKSDTQNATKHIDQALKRLQEGGRLVAIVGQGMADNAPAFSSWWKEIKAKYNVRANIGLYSDEDTGRFKHTNDYKKYGTDFGIQILVIDKTGPTVETEKANFVDMEIITQLLGGIANDRRGIQEDSNGKQDSGSDDLQNKADGKRGDNSDGSSSPDTSNTMGTGQHSGSKRKSSTRTGKNGNGPAKHEGGETDNNNETTGRNDNSTGNGEGDSEGTGRGTDKQDVSSIDGINVETAENKTSVDENEIFSQYEPQKLNIKGAKPHASELVQSTAMASVEPPDATYSPKIPKEIITSGTLSLAQIETVVYAGQSHSIVNNDGTRQGFFIGDGTGVGKGRQIAGIILDNWNQGRKKAIWFSKNKKLFVDAIRDWTALKGDKKDVFKAPSNASIERPTGIMFATYGLLGQGQKPNKKGEKAKLSRLDQIVEWVGKDFDGVLVFDESHMMGNLLGRTPSEMAKYGVELQNKLPNARIVYASATGATEVENFAYATRLKLWGRGTAFDNLSDFVSKIQAGGLAAMELIARDLKAMGLYIARNVSFKGVGYSTLEHNLTPIQTEIYDTMAEGWQVVLQNINEYLKVTGADKNAKAKRYIMQNFWSTQQRFFNQILTSMQMPAVIEDMKRKLGDGESCVLQIVNTNAAAEEREAARIAEDEDLDLDDMDITPKAALIGMIDICFPTQLYEDYTDDNGKPQSRPVVDKQGNPVHSKEALAAKKQLVDMLERMQIPNGAMDMILQEFGVDN
ncbi:MAG: strawberry notch-like NTP hydrolase domain-containing protein, partial [Clostridia bacterium]